jgi:uncharacterized BrkB/YihY/UPF0761 family membrane protein
VVVGAGLVLTTVLASLSTFGSVAWLLKVVGVVLSVGVNVAIYAAVFRLTTPDEVATAALLPGAVAGGFGWSLLQALGGYLIGHQLRHASQVTGTSPRCSDSCRGCTWPRRSCSTPPS